MIPFDQISVKDECHALFQPAVRGLPCDSEGVYVCVCVSACVKEQAHLYVYASVSLCVLCMQAREGASSSWGENAEWEDLIPIPCAQFQYTHSNTHTHTLNILSSLEPVHGNIRGEKAEEACVRVCVCVCVCARICAVRVKAQWLLLFFVEWVLVAQCVCMCEKTEKQSTCVSVLLKEMLLGVMALWR